MNMEVQRQPVFSPRITEDAQGNPCYLVEYDEDQWNKYDKAGQEHCFATWADKAKPMGARFVVLRLIPDPIFPTGDRTVPYVARSYVVDQETFNPISVSVKLIASVDADTWARALDGERMKIKTAARHELAMHGLATKGAAYEIFTRENNAPVVIERGRL